MGWKSVQEHYGIKHIVANFPEKGLCIGSGYCHDLITIVQADRKLDFEDTVDRRPTSIGCGLAVWRPVYLGRAAQSNRRRIREIEQDLARMRGLLEERKRALVKLRRDRGPVEDRP